MTLSTPSLLPRRRSKILMWSACGSLLAICPALSQTAPPLSAEVIRDYELRWAELQRAWSARERGEASRNMAESKGVNPAAPGVPGAAETGGVEPGAAAPDASVPSVGKPAAGEPATSDLGPRPWKRDALSEGKTPKELTGENSESGGQAKTKPGEPRKAPARAVSPVPRRAPQAARGSSTREELPSVPAASRRPAMEPIVPPAPEPSDEAENDRGDRLRLKGPRTKYR